MIGLAIPVGLLGLLLVPVVWYLHRSGPILRRQPVASLELWRDGAARAPDAGTRRRADPAWWRRAAILALLCVALAGPQVRRPAEQVTVWIDDSLSMQTVEHGRARLDTGIDEVLSALHAAGARDVQWRLLSAPMLSDGLGAARNLRDPSPAVAAREPRPPPPEALDPTRRQWLVTDGADAVVNAWLARSAIDRVFQVASDARNVGITQLTVRPQPANAAARAIQVVVRNGGAAAETRDVELVVDGSGPDTHRISLAPGATGYVTFATDRPVTQVAARLLPADALTADDTAVVDASPLQSLATRVAAHCPAAVVRAIAAHPALRPTRTGSVWFAVDCGSHADRNESVPRLVVRAGPAVALPSGAILWSPTVPAAVSGTLDSVLAGMRGRLDPPRPADAVLVAAGDTPLVIVRAGRPRVVETSIDLDAPELAATDAAPLLLSLLIDTALETSLLDRTAGLVRDARAPLVASRATLQAHPRPFRAATGDSAALARSLILLALALLSWDVLSLGRRLWRNHGPRADASA